MSTRSGEPEYFIYLDNKNDIVMKIKCFITAVTILTFLFTLGTNEASAQKKSKETSPENAIVPQVNPLVIELETFEGRSLGGERNYIGIVGNIIQGKVSHVNGMVRTGRMSGRDALVFNKCEAEIGEASVNRKGTSYSFDVHVDDVLFFNSNPNTDWLLSITVFNDGKVSVDISSDSIARVFSQRTWTFMGRINGERTLSLKKLMEDNPGMMMLEEF